ncbi:MAG: PD-(D/E)XK nuclease family protein, partial [Bacteroidales bacterium]|nr:PD-(D/E)XK nuclease family protein [Bacteroidales bacterium]
VDEVCWMPRIITIQDVFLNNSKLNQAEDLLLIYKLYNVFISYTKSEESFDNFYYWGEIILNDFDDIDKYLVDASKLFSTIRDLKEIDNRFEGYQEEEIEIIRRFWIHINDSRLSIHKQKFLELWQAMFDIYSKFREEIIKENIAYPGLIYRKVAENIDNCVFDKTEYIIVGFNALNKCEKKLFEYLKKNKKTRFFWDADKYYLEDDYQEAGRFLRENIKKFPAHLNIGIVDNIKPVKKNIEVITAPSPVSQVKMLEGILEEWKKEKDFNPEKVALVLGDENLLIPLISSLPPYIEPYNVSMGFPVKNSAAYGFIYHLVSLRRRSRQQDGVCNFYFKDVLSVINHSFIRTLFYQDVCELEKQINVEKMIYVESQFCNKNKFFADLFLSGINTIPELCQWIRQVCSDSFDLLSVKDEFAVDSEFLNKILSRISVLNDSITEAKVELKKPEIFYRLLLNAVRSLSVAFEGEPLLGMQVLGFLETRCLDFDKIVMISVNEGIFPKKSAAQSLIPYNLRRFYELPSIEYQDSIFAYYFYRLLQRSKDIKIIYSAQAGDSGSEASRFISQLKFESGQDIKYRNDGYQINISSSKKAFAKKTDKIQAKVLEILKKGISPKAINEYLNCPFRFYLDYVEEIKEPKKLEEQEDSAFFGKLFHEIVRELYEPYIGKVLNEKDFDEICKKSNIENAKIVALKKVFGLKSQAEINRYNQKLIVDIVLKYVNSLLNYDKRSCPLTIISLEKSHTYTFNFSEPGEKESIEILITGYIDRVDLHNGYYRVFDYKTGKIVQKVKSLDMLFEKNRKVELNTITQILLYSLMISNDENKSVCPGAVNINELSEEYNYYLNIGDVELEKFDKSQIKSDFLKFLEQMFCDLIDKEAYFNPTDNIKTCEYCPYKIICDR